MDYSPWSSKNLIDRNRLKKIMQLSVDVTYIHAHFGGHDLSGFADIATFKNGKISLTIVTIGLLTYYRSSTICVHNNDIKLTVNIMTIFTKLKNIS